MKLKNVKKGQRVVTKPNDIVETGSRGVIIEDDSHYPYINWDKGTVFLNNHSPYPFDGYKNVKCVDFKYLKKEKNVE